MLLNDGYKVRALSRKPEDLQKSANEAPWIGQVDWVKADIRNADTTKNVMKGIDYVIFAPGARAYKEGIENNKLVFADAVEIFGDMAKKAGVKRFVMISSGGITSWQSYNPQQYLYDVLK